MDAIITGESERIGLSIIDNNDIEHLIEMNEDGEITGHKQEGYPDDPGKRTNEQAEHVNQARRFARWHVYRERGYDTVESGENPDRILAALLAIADLPQAVFDNQFDDLVTRIRRHYDASTVNLPFEDANPEDIIVYKKDLYVKPDPTTFDPPVLEQFLTLLDGESESPEMPTKETIEAFDPAGLEFEIEATSEVHTLHNDGYDNERESRGSRPLNREPDATIELMPVDPAEINTFQHYVVSHLAYQIRDCFLRMGVKPPVAFRAQGQGKYRGSIEQRFCDLYENYHSPQATIDSWQPG